MTVFKQTFLSLFLIILGLAISSPGHALLEIEITQGVESAFPIAIMPVTGDAPIPATLVESVVYADLHRSGFFSIVDKQFYPQQGEIKQVDYDRWRNNGIEALLTMRVNTAENGQYRVEFELYDLVRKKRALGHAINTKKNLMRKVAHKISDVVFESITGVKGAFSTRIAYISELTKAKSSKKFILQIADADGFNPRTVYASPKQLMSPAWSPDGRRLAYVSFENERSEIFVQDLTSGTRSKISSAPGINSAPAWSPDGGYLALTLSSGGNPDIYIMDVNSRKLRKLTNHHGIDTEPAWSPDGRFIYFTSNRSGAPQIYQMPFGGGSPKRLTFEGNYNAAPTVSADGKYIGMVHNGGQGYRIAILDMQRNSFRLLTDGSLDEGPSFAPNGSMIIYSTHHNKSTVLSAVSADGRVRQRLRLQEGKVREPAWSPFR